jgi:hypothetical protein
MTFSEEKTDGVLVLGISGKIHLYLSGSRKHLIQKMFLDRSRPLYRAAGHYPLGPIEAKHWLPFIRRKFRDAQKGITDHTVKVLCLAEDLAVIIERVEGSERIERILPSAAPSWIGHGNETSLSHHVTRRQLTSEIEPFL